MILRSLQISNFRQICGEFRIEFAPPGDRSVTVILGDNGAGKTTLLNAFTWCLYGRVRMANADDVLSYKALQDSPIGATLRTEVSLVFENDGTVYTVTRAGEYRKEDGGKVTCTASPDAPRVDRVTSTGASGTEADPKRFINLILPEGLSSFFFFRGEDMEKLALRESANSLRDGVEVFLDVKVLDSAIKHSEALKGDIESELRSISHGEVKELSDKIAEAQRNKEVLSTRLDEVTRNVAKQEEIKDAIDADLARSEQVRPYLEQQRALSIALKKLEEEELPIRVSALCSVISRDAFLWPVSNVLEAPVRLAAEAVKAGELPASIKPVFVDDRIGLGICICGTPIDEKARAALLAWKKVAGLALVDEEVMELRSACGFLAARRDESWGSFERERAQLADTHERIRSTRGELSAVTTELEGKDFKLDEVSALQNRLRTVVNELIAEKTERNRLTDKILEITEMIAALEKERGKKTTGEAAVARLSRQGLAIGNVAKAVQRMKQGWTEIVQRYLDTKLKSTWRDIAQLDRLVEFSPEFRLGMKELGGHKEWINAAPSQANEVALSLAFIASLVRFARDMAEAERRDPSAARRLFRGGEFPLVMDAPFAKLDRDFKERIPEGLKRVVPQIVLITNHDQWRGVVEERLGGSVGKRYVIEMHRPGDGEDGKRVGFLGDSVEYVVSEPKALRDWSVISAVPAGGSR